MDAYEILDGGNNLHQFEQVTIKRSKIYGIFVFLQRGPTKCSRFN
jgi:hypothetical protein